MRSKSPDESDLYVTAPTPVGFSPSSAWSVTQAVVSAKSESSLGALSLLRPKRTSVKPTYTGLTRMSERSPLVLQAASTSDASASCARRGRPSDPLGDGTAHLPRDLGERRKPLLERRMIHEQLGGPGAHL